MTAFYNQIKVAVAFVQESYKLFTKVAALQLQATAKLT